MEPNLAEDVVDALYAPTGAIVCPFHLTMALAENACENGVEFFLNTEVTNIKKAVEGYELTILKKPVGAAAAAGKEPEQESIRAKVVVNAAGVYAHVFNNIVTVEKL